MKFLHEKRASHGASVMRERGRPSRSDGQDDDPHGQKPCRDRTGDECQDGTQAIEGRRAASFGSAKRGEPGGAESLVAPQGRRLPVEGDEGSIGDHHDVSECRVPDLRGEVPLLLQNPHGVNPAWRGVQSSGGHATDRAAAGSAEPSRLSGSVTSMRMPAVDCAACAK